MFLAPEYFPLKDGRTGLLRTADAADAEALLANLRLTAAETEFLLRSSTDALPALEQERDYLHAMVQSETDGMFLCFVEEELSGSCFLSIGKRAKIRHRAELAVAVRQKDWGLGIGTALLQRAVSAARLRGVSQMELTVAAENRRAVQLYEKLGFSVVSRHPAALRLPDGTLLDNLLMILSL